MDALGVVGSLGSALIGGITSIFTMKEQAKMQKENDLANERIQDSNERIAGAGLAGQQMAIDAANTRNALLVIGGLAALALLLKD